MRRSFTIAAIVLAGCGLFPDLSTLQGGDASTADVSSDSPADASAYADVRIHCQQRPCVGQIGETCCWFTAATDTCVSADACAGYADLACYGTMQCLAVGKSACCATGANTVCTDVATCNTFGGTVLCDRGDGGSFGDPSDDTCPSPLACTGTTTFEGYSWRSCQ